MTQFYTKLERSKVLSSVRIDHDISAVEKICWYKMVCVAQLRKKFVRVLIDSVDEDKVAVCRLVDKLQTVTVPIAKLFLLDRRFNKLPARV